MTDWTTDDCEIEEIAVERAEAEAWHECWVILECDLVWSIIERISSVRRATPDFDIPRFRGLGAQLIRMDNFVQCTNSCHSLLRVGENITALLRVDARNAITANGVSNGVV